MFKALIRWSLINRHLMLGLTIIFCLYAGYCLQKMPIDVFPEFAPPQVVIQTEAPGMAPKDVEALITYPLESAINGTPGVAMVRSKTTMGLSTITVIFADGTDIFRNRQLINERLQQAQSRLPPGVAAPVMLPVTSAVGWLVKYALVSQTASPERLRTIADWTIRPRILALGGIASVVAIGGEVKQYQVILQPQKLLAYQITIDEIRSALAAANQNVPGAFLQQAGGELTVGTVGRISSLADIKNTLIATREGVPITLGNLAIVRFGGEIKRGDGAFNLDNAVIGTISKAWGADTLTTTAAVEKTLLAIQKSLPKGIELQMNVFRQANFIESAIANLSRALLEGALIVIGILVLFLMNWRAALITFLAMPLSFMVGIVILYHLGYGINAMTLGGIAIAIGEVVDDGIITVENVMHRLRLAGEASPLKVILQAILEIRSSVIFATVIICMVFLPVFFLTGIAQRIFSPMAVAYIASVGGSLLVSLTTVPALCYLFLSAGKGTKSLPGAEAGLGLAPSALQGVQSLYVPPPSMAASRADGAKPSPASAPGSDLEPNQALTKTTGLVESLNSETKFVRWLKQHYLAILNRCLDHWRWVMGASLAALLFSLALIPFFKTAFLPEFHEGNFIIGMTTLPGTSLNESMRLGQDVRARLLKYPQVISISQRAGRSELDEDALPPNMSEFDVRLDFNKDPNVPVDSLIRNIRHELEHIPGAVFNIGQFIAHRMDEVLSGVRAEVAIKIFGEDLQTLNHLGQEVEGLLKQIPGVVDINREQQINVPQLIIRIDRQKAARYGIQVGQISDDIQILLNGMSVTRVLEGQKTFDLYLRMDAAARDSIADIANMLIDTHDNQNNGGKIPLRAVADVSLEPQPFAINRENVQRFLTISFNISEADLGAVIATISQQIKDKIQLPPGYYVDFGGQFESQQQASRVILIFSLVVVLMMLMLLYKAFGHFTDALLVMANLPLALIGGLLSLYLLNGVMSIAAMIGFITLFGIATRNGIILVSHYRQLMPNELDRDLIIQGTLDRLVPVLMTAATAALALLPILWGAPTGKELQRPLAQVLIGGIFSATLLNLIVIPTLYYHYAWRKSKRKGK